MFESHVETSVLLVIQSLLDIFNILRSKIVLFDDEFKFVSILWEPHKELLVTQGDWDFLISLWRPDIAMSSRAPWVLSSVSSAIMASTMKSVFLPEVLWYFSSEFHKPFFPSFYTFWIFRNCRRHLFIEGRICAWQDHPKDSVGFSIIKMRWKKKSVLSVKNLAR